MRLAGALAIAVALTGLWLYAAFRAAMARPFGSIDEPVTIDYEKGMSGEELAAALERQGIIQSRWLFQAARALRPDEVLQAGEYEFREPVSVWDVFEKLAEGRVRLYPITIPEGLTRFETAQRIAESGFGSEQRFLALTEDAAPIRDLFPQAKTLEGCLFPETYSLPRGATEADLLAAMLDRFRQAFGSVSHKSALDSYDTLVLASMIEKETGVESERTTVSSVYHNRLRIGMRMQCDPTVIYGLLLDGAYRGKLYTADLETPNPYNTYLNKGLPPGPIASPGLASIQAAANPAKSNYLYFVARSEGGPDHVFTASLREHNRAVAAYRRTQR